MTPRTSLDLGVQETVTERLAVNPEGMLLVVTPNDVSMFDAGLKRVKQLALPSSAFMVYPQPDRKALRISFANGLAGLVDTSTLGCVPGLTHCF